MSFSVLSAPVLAVDFGTIVGGVAGVVGFLDFSLELYDRWKKANPNTPDTEYPGFNPGGMFGGGVGRDELNEKYLDYVSELPADNINSQGMSSFYITGWYYSRGSAVMKISSESDYLYFEGYNSNDVSFFSVDASSGQFTVPVSGTYEVVFPSPSFSKIHDSDLDSFRCLFSGGSYDYEELGRLDTGFRKKLALVAGQSYRFRCECIFVENEDSLPHGVAYYRCYRPYISGIFVSGLDSDTYNINTRPTSITGGNYGIVGDNGQIVKVEGNTIVNETNNTYYNPSTGTTVPIVNWSYDYSDRSYKVALESGDTVTVTYGDENVTIQEGDTVYNVYYLVDGSGTEQPPEVCAHEWSETSRTDPTCTVAGQAVSTCSKCQEVKTEPVPALGHDWQIKQSVKTEYDDTGQLVQEGYTIFECSRCQEQYKSTDGTIPPGGGSGTDPGGDEDETLWDKLGKLLGTAVKGILELLGSAVDVMLGGLIDLVTNLFESLKQLVDLFGTVGEAFQVLWTWLPPEITAILAAGVSIFVFVALLKFFMK